MTTAEERGSWSASLGQAAPSAWTTRLAWLVAVTAIFSLGTIRAATGAEFAFASLGLLPVLLIAWVTGRTAGFFAAALATATWIAGDIVSERHFSSSWIPWANGLTRLAIYCIVVGLAVQVRGQLSRERDRAMRDQLTGLVNRHALLETGLHEVERSRRYGRPLALVFIDLDNFKSLNDRDGHASGDAALRAASQALQATSRSTDTLARWGGDEFVVLLPEVDRDSAALTGRRLLDALREALEPFPGTSASVGVAWFEHAEEPFSALLDAADETMYLAKQQGKNTVCVRNFPVRP